MSYRRSISDKKSASTFTRGAMNINQKNVGGRPMRGGIRL